MVVRRIGIGVVIVVGAAVWLLLGIAFWLHTHVGQERVRVALEQVASERLGARVRIGRVGGSILSDLSLDDVRVGSAAPVARAARVRARYAPLSLVAGRVTGDVEIDGAELDLDGARRLLERARARLPQPPSHVALSLHLRDARVREGTRPPSPPVDVALALELDGDRLALRDLVVRSGELRIAGGAAIDLAARAVDATLDELRVPAGEPPLPFAPVLTQPLVARGTASGPWDDVRLGGRARIGDARIELAGTLDARRRRVAIEVTVDDLEPPLAESSLPTLWLRVTAHGALTARSRGRLDAQIDGRWRQRPYDAALASLPSARARRIAADRRATVTGGRVVGNAELHLDDGGLHGAARVRLETEGESATLLGARGPSRGLLVTATLTTVDGRPRVRVASRSLEDAGADVGPKAGGDPAGPTIAAPHNQRDARNGARRVAGRHGRL